MCGDIASVDLEEAGHEYADLGVERNPVESRGASGDAYGIEEIGRQRNAQEVTKAPPEGNTAFVSNLIEWTMERERANLMNSAASTFSG